MLHVFRSLPTVQAVVRLAEAIGASGGGYARDSITLGWEERLRTRARRRSDGGIEFGTALPRGTVLRAGDALVVDALRLVVVVAERPEHVLMITPRTGLEWGLWGYQLGNSHQPIMLTATTIVCLDDVGMRQVLAHHAIPYQTGLCPFTPVGLTTDHRHPAAGRFE